MKITVLGCGASYGVPSLFNGFGKCNPNNPKNIRCRSSILVSENNQNILIDTPPEIRLELLQNKIKKIDALLYTHSHFDHMTGAEDVRNLTRKSGQILDIYGTKFDLSEYKNQMRYAFKDKKHSNSINLHPIKMYTPFEVKNISILPIKQYHGTVKSVGYRIGKFAYSTDLKNMDLKGLKLLKGIETWILECTTDKEVPSHVSLNKIFEWVDYIEPKHTYLTHLGTEWDYDRLLKKLPENIEPVYDGMVIKTKY